MTITETLLPAFILGFLGSWHCLGMCGPLVFSLSWPSTGWVKQIFIALYYNTMRIVSYGMIGFILGLLGEWTRGRLGFLGGQKFLSIFSGTILILWSLGYQRSSFVPFGKKIDVFLSRLIIWLSSYLKNLKKNHPLNLGVLGLLHGWLPCGLVYTAVIASLGYSSHDDGGGRADLSLIFMLAFGLGTLPMMVFSFIGFSRIHQRFAHRFRTWIPFFLFILGGLLVLRGVFPLHAVSH